jgi:hypothetical protein
MNTRSLLILCLLLPLTAWAADVIPLTGDTTKRVISERDLQVTVTPYYLTRNVLEVVAECRPSVSEATLRAALRHPEHVEPIAERRIDMPKGGGRGRLELDASRLPVGERYLLTVELLESSRVTVEKRLTVERPPAPAWHQTPLGTRAGVPAPWTPVTYSKGHLSVWGRTLTLGKGLLPVQLTSQRTPLLAAPLELALKLDGISVGWDECTPTILEQSDERVRLAVRREVIGGELEATLTVEFDGFCWYTLTIRPQQPLTLNRLALDGRFPVDTASHYAAFGLGSIGSTRPGTLEGRPGGEIPAATSLPFCSSLWLGNGDLGLQFLCESDEGWHPAEPTSALRLVRGDGQTHLTVDIVGQPRQLTRPYTVEFGFMAAPVKPMGDPTRFWGTNSIHWLAAPADGKPAHFNADEDLTAFVQRVLGQWVGGPTSGTTLTARSYRESGVPLAHVYGWNPRFGAPYSEQDGHDEKVRRLIEASHAAVPGMKLALYTGWGINRGLSMWSTVGKEMTRYPFEASGWNTELQCARSSFTDFFVDGAAQLLRTYGADGLYLDSTGNVPCCARIGHGCGYVDAEGRLHGTYPIRATRELFKRLYQVTHGEVVRDGLVYLHTTNMMLPVVSFADVLLTAEVEAANWKTLDGIGLPTYRAKWLGRPTGVPTLLCWHSFKRPPIGPNQILGYALVHGDCILGSPVHLLNYANGAQTPGYASDRYVLRHLTRLMTAFKGQAAPRFYPYWSNQAHLTVETPQVLGSFYQNTGGETLLILCNLAPTAQTATVRLTPPGGRRASVRDALLDEPLAWTAPGTLTVNLEPQGYRLLWVK